MVIQEPNFTAFISPLFIFYKFSNGITPEPPFSWSSGISKCSNHVPGCTILSLEGAVGSLKFLFSLWVKVHKKQSPLYKSYL